MFINVEYEDIAIEVCPNRGTKLRPITTMEGLHLALQKAIELEFSTIPTYLCGLYTIMENTNTPSYAIIRSVVMEEMFHLSNAANVLISTGGSPAINRREFIPTFPTPVPDGEHWFVVNLLKFSPKALETYLYIEEPGQNAPGLITIGDFYENIQEGLEYLAAQPDVELFPDRTLPQVAAKYYYGGGGEVTRVTDLESAMFAINAIIAQGEGIPSGSWDPTEPFPNLPTGLGSGDHQLFMQSRELSHYYRFNELKQGRRYVAGDSPNSGPTGPAIPIDYGLVYNMKPNPRASDYEGLPELAAMNFRFNVTFSELLDLLHRAFNGDPGVLESAVGMMFELKYLARALMRNPLPGPEGYYAGPSWDYIDPRNRPRVGSSHDALRSSIHDQR